jgi:histidyl-tRNA synthetase
MKKMICAVAMCALMAVVFMPRNARAVEAETAGNLLTATELLMISQANLAILALNLNFTNMEHNYTTVDEDRENLKTIVDSIDLSSELIKTIMKSKEIEDNDLELIRLLDRTDESLIKSANELIGYCDDQSATHFSNFSDDMEEIVKYMDKAGKILEKAE